MSNNNRAAAYTTSSEGFTDNPEINLFNIGVSKLILTRTSTYRVIWLQQKSTKASMQKWGKLLEGYRLACRITHFVNIYLCQQAFHVIVPISICSLHSFKLLQDISLNGWVSIFITMKQTRLKLSDLKRSATQFFWSDSV